MPYDDRSNYEKGGAEELGAIGWLVGTLQLKLRKRQLGEEPSLSLIEDPSRGPQAIFFDPPP